MMGGRDIEWTPEMDVALRAMRRERKCITECGAALGLSKNAVLNRIDRLGLPVLNAKPHLDGARALATAGIAILDKYEPEDADREPLPPLHDVTCSVLQPDPREYRGRL